MLILLYVLSGNIVVFQRGRSNEEQFTCQYRFDASDWDDEEHIASNDSYPVEVLAVKTLTLEPPIVEHIGFEGVAYRKTDEEGNFYDLWGGYRPPSVTVRMSQFPGLDS